MNALGEIIGAEIRAAGPIPFHRFMELALYHPTLGYYEHPPFSHNLDPDPNPNLHSSLPTPDSALPLGRRGDFYTSVSVGSLFGELLAFQFAEWQEPGGSGRFQLVEAGAHDGALARDILAWIRGHRPELMDRLEYWIMEPSPRRRQWQERTLADFAGTVRWFTDLRDFSGAVDGVIFANELLDSFPIRRFAWDASARKWFEWGVAVKSDRFVWAQIPLDTGKEKTPDFDFLPSELESVLPHGFVIEHCPQAARWWRNAADALRHGHLLTFDYGFSREELVVPERTGGTLRGYRAHHLVDDVLANPGEQDLTAHVNFAALQSVGESEGLRTEDLIAQTRFVTRIAQHAMLPTAHFGDWTPSRVRQFQTLTHPEHLGRAFRVLLQKR